MTNALRPATRATRKTGLRNQCRIVWLSPCRAAANLKSVLDGLDIHQSATTIERGKHLTRRMLAPQLRDLLRPGAIRGQIHAAQQRMPSPCARQFVSTLFADQEIAAERLRNFFLRGSLAPGQVR